MKILLVQPFKDPGIAGESYPPIGLGYLATSARQSGHSVRILDCLKDNYNYDSFIEAIKDASPNLIGINVFSISIPFVKKMIALIKDESPNTSILLGGPHVSSLPDQTLTYFDKADFAIRGEGEVPLKMLVDRIESGSHDFHDIPGLIYREKDGIKMNNPYFTANVEEYGMPAWDLIKPDEYFKYLSIGSDSVPVFFSRGCPFPCTFCAAKVTSGQKLRRRGLDHIFQELNMLAEKYGIKRFIIEDEGFGVTKEFILNFCRRVRRENFQAEFAMGVGMRLDIVDRELLTAMSESNFERTIVLGIESGSERILKLMKKKTDLRMIGEKVGLMNEMGFEPNGYFILGYPSETRDEMEETIKLALRLDIKEASFTAFQPLPGTAATEQLIETGELPSDFDFTAVAQNKIVYAPRGMSVQELGRIRKRAILRFYLRPKILIRYFASRQRLVYAFKKFVAVFLKKNVVKTVDPQKG